LEGLLQEDYFDGQSFRQLINEPLLYGVAAWVIGKRVVWAVLMSGCESCVST
jgi:hypothetical protein